MLDSTRTHDAAKELGDVPAQLAALGQMTVGQLAARYRELYGVPTRTRNKPYLQKRLAWRIQELAEGEAAVSAMARVHERVALLGAELPERWRMRIAAQQKDPATGLQPSQRESKSIEPLEPRDPRIPSVGTELIRIFKGTQYTVTVCREGFEHAGHHFKTLSAVAKQITGVPWNGFEFFRINSRGATSPAGGES